MAIYAFSFKENVTKLLNEYKQILRRQLSQNQSRLKIKELGLKQTQLRKDNDVALFHKAHVVIRDLDSWAKSLTQQRNYCGIEDFLYTFKRLMTDYKLQHNTVVHTSQKASKALVEALQLMSATTENLSNIIVEKLEQCSQVIAEFGTKEHHDKLLSALKKYEVRNTNFMPILCQFEKHVSA